MTLFRRRSPEKVFWQWFAQNSDRLFRFESEREAVFAELTAALAKARKGLTFEFGPIDSGRREFIVSADGSKALFPAVRNLVAEAPTMKEWEVIPFRPPKSLDLVIQFGPHKLGADDVWFQEEPDGPTTGLHLFVRGLTEENKETLGGAAFILLDNALGEYAVETQVGFVNLQTLPEDPIARGLKPFSSIRSAFDRVHH